MTAAQEGLELWKKLAPSLGLQEDKPTKEAEPKNAGAAAVVKRPKYH